METRQLRKKPKPRTNIDMIANFEGGNGDEQSLPRSQKKGHSVIVFDIETGPAPDDVIEAHMPEFEAPANYKDPAKIALVLEEKKAAYKEKAALSPLTGEVLAIGAWIDDSYFAKIRGIDGVESESEILAWFWGLISPQTILIGFNSNRFDLPFLAKRSWALGVEHAACRVNPNGRIDSRSCWDLMEMWGFGDKSCYISLDAVSRFFGVGSKNGDGELFYKVLRAFPDEAEEYLKNDVHLTFEVAKRMGLLHGHLEFEAPEAVVARGSETDTEEDY